MGNRGGKITTINCGWHPIMGYDSRLNKNKKTNWVLAALTSSKGCSVTSGLKVLPPWLFRHDGLYLGTARSTKLFLPWVALFSVFSSNNGKINKISNTDNKYRHPRKDTCSSKVYDLKKPLWTEFGKQCQKNQEQPESLGWTCPSSILVPSNKPLNFVAGVRPPLPFYFRFVCVLPAVWFWLLP